MDELDSLMEQLSNKGSGSSSSSSTSASQYAPSPTSSTSSGGVHYCAKCSNVIIGLKATVASGRSYHPEHFTCTKCSKPLTMSDYFEVSDGIVCRLCHEQYYLHKCTSCHQPIEGEAIVALGSRYHPHHFTCSVCSTSMSASAFYESKGLLYCERHAPGAQSNVYCTACSRPIEGNYKKAAGRSWHTACFACYGCRASLATGTLFEIRGNPYCGKCAPKVL